jgi:LytS/YehU family sensor histidine kinase
MLISSPEELASILSLETKAAEQTWLYSSLNYNEMRLLLPSLFRPRLLYNLINEIKSITKKEPYIL